MQRRRILLINPHVTSMPRFPLAVLQLAGALRERFDVQLLDGNVEADPAARACALVREQHFDAVGLTVMGGPQLVSGFEISQALRAAAPALPLIWGGYFPTICPGATLACGTVDYVLRGQGEQGLTELLDAHFDGASEAALDAVAGLSWRAADGIRHNPDRTFSREGLAQGLDLTGLDHPERYLSPTYLGRRTTGYQAALGCRYHCTFCGVAAMFKGKTALPTDERLHADLSMLRDRFGADSVTFYDHNFFDREVEMAPLLEVLARLAMPWWCFARADALVNMSEQSWALVRKSRLRMAYIGAESPSDATLRDMRKGTKSDQTLEAVERCRANGVVPELSFMLAPPHDPEGETERCFDFIRRIKRAHPGTEVMLYVNTPLPPRQHGGGRKPVNLSLPPGMRFPDTLQGWTEPQWVRYWCHKDAPWVTPRLRRRIEDFTTVLGCRFPTQTDIRTSRWQKRALSVAAAWRYRLQRYDRPHELDLLRRFVRLWDPQLTGL